MSRAMMWWSVVCLVATSAAAMDWWMVQLAGSQEEGRLVSRGARRQDTRVDIRQPGNLRLLASGVERTVLEVGAPQPPLR